MTFGISTRLGCSTLPGPLFFRLEGSGAFPSKSITYRPWLARSVNEKINTPLPIKGNTPMVTQVLSRSISGSLTTTERCPTLATFLFLLPGQDRTPTPNASRRLWGCHQENYPPYPPGVHTTLVTWPRTRRSFGQKSAEGCWQENYSPSPGNSKLGRAGGRGRELRADVWLLTQPGWPAAGGLLPISRGLSGFLRVSWEASRQKRRKSTTLWHETPVARNITVVLKSLLQGAYRPSNTFGPNSL